MWISERKLEMEIMFYNRNFSNNMRYHHETEYLILKVNSI